MQAQQRDARARLLHIDPVRGATASNQEDEAWFRRVADNRLELERTGKATALVTLCIGGGMGIATIIERL